MLIITPMNGPNEFVHMFARPVMHIGVMACVARIIPLKTIDAAISKLIPADKPGHNRYGKAARLFTPPAALFDTLLDDAWDVIEGNTHAANQFRKSLALLGSSTVPAGQCDEKRGGETALHRTGGAADCFRGGAVGEFLTQSRAAQSGMRALGAGMFTDHLGLEHPCVMPPERYLPIAVAGLLISADLDDAVRLLGSLEAGLRGLDVTQLMFEYALGTLGGGDGGRLEQTLNFVSGEYGLDDEPFIDGFYIPLPDGPGPDFPGLGMLNHCFLDRNRCLGEAAWSFERMGASGVGRYEITSITPLPACPGDVLIIQGTNFGATGSVSFPNRRLVPSTVTVLASSWSDTEIRVTVPQDATSGELGLKIFGGTMALCGHVMSLPRRGTGLDFEGGLPNVSALTVNGSEDTLCVAPGNDIDIAWASNSGTAHTVHLVVREGAIVRLNQSSLAAAGSVIFPVPADDSDHRYAITLTATNACGDHERTHNVVIGVAADLTIEGVELTQGIQQFSVIGPLRNTLRLFQDKDTIARVYISSDRDGFNSDRMPNVTGTLTIDGDRLFPINGITPDNPTGGNPFITARPLLELDREETDHTLNFRIPANLCRATKTIEVDVFVDDPCGTAPVSGTLTQQWRVIDDLKVRYVRISDDGPNGSGTRPSSDEALFTITRAFDLLPSAPDDIGAAWQTTWDTNHDLTDDDGLVDLLNDLNDEHNCNLWEWGWQWTGLTECHEADEAIWVGLTKPFNRGLGKRPGNTCLSAVYAVSNGQSTNLRIKTAHEMGHNLSFKHVDRCGAGEPFYDHPNGGVLQEVPFDPFWNEAIDGTASDFMTYCSDRWVSADSWRRLEDKIGGF
jgi:hypothetical protein